MSERSCQTCRNFRDNHCLLFKENLNAEDAKIDLREKLLSVRIPDNLLHFCAEQICVAKQLKYWQKRFIEYGRIRTADGEEYDVVLRVPKDTSLGAAMLLLHQNDAEMISWLTQFRGQPKVINTNEDTLYLWYANYGINDESYQKFLGTLNTHYQS